MSYEREADQYIEQLVGPDDPIYEHFADVPSDRPFFLFNNGHVKYQLFPYLQDLIENYEAQAFKVRSTHPAKEYHVFVGIPPERLADWVESKINEGSLVDVVVSFCLSLLEFLPESELKKRLQQVAADRVDVTAVKDILFGLRQQIGQRNDPVSYLNIAEGNLEAGQTKKAEERLAILQTTFRAMHRQYDAGLIFFNQLNEFLKDKHNAQRFGMHEQLLFELDNMKVMLDQVEEILKEETLYQLKILNMQTRIRNQPRPE